ncbi:MAG: L,D-transpeptidase [Polyangiaceae bacterium]|nr:L,D-transpeptidase [Polyangiaceae bacterium]
MDRPVVLVVAAFGVLVGCKHSAAPDDEADAQASSMAAEAGAALPNASGAGSEAAGEAFDAGTISGPTIFAFELTASIFNVPEWPRKDPQAGAGDGREVIRLGYLRRGGHAPVKGKPSAKGNCPGGWYELTIGGFVCAKYASMDPSHKGLRRAAHMPWLDRDLPYDYGLNLTPGTPLYRRIPTPAERKVAENLQAVGKGSKSSDIAKKLAAEGTEVPAYLKNEHVGFDDLKGDPDLVSERMLKGFYLALDKEISGISGMFWRTASGNYVPKDHLIVHGMKKEFEGVDFTSPGETRKLPLAWVTTTRAHKYGVSDGKATQHEKMDRFAVVTLTGKMESIGKKYWETDQGYWLRGIDLAVVKMPQDKPSDLLPNEKWIDVDIRNETLVALEGDRPVYATIISSGRKDHATVEGSFRIREKHITTTMDGDAATDGTYRIEEVPWVMYFEKAFALHGAFWHSAFGHEKSHGCVNLMPHDARHLFFWAGPSLPEGWHGVRATKDNLGTRVIVHR